MLINIDVIKSFVKELKSMSSRGQDEYPFWYLYEDEFKQLDSLINFYEEYLKKD